MQIVTRNLVFEIDQQGRRPRFFAPGQGMQWQSKHFWQLILMDRVHHIDEICIHSGDQQGKCCQEADGTIRICYDSLVDLDGDQQDIQLEVIIWREGELLQFKTIVENHQPDLMVLECRCPMLTFSRLCGQPEEDILYMPDGMGKRVKNPWAMNRISQPYNNDYAHHQNDFQWSSIYPGGAMAWMGVESGDKFLYVGRHDERIRLCAFQVRIPHPIVPTRQTMLLDDNPTARKRGMMLSVAHLPAAKTGERVETPPVCVALLDGDWRKGADCYRAFAEKSFFTRHKKVEWAENFLGFWPVHVRHPISKKPTVEFEDLKELYLEGRRYGIHSILLFGWWDTPMNTDLPNHSICPENAARLKKAIREVQELGGRIILMCNATYINLQTDYYKEHGKEVAHLDIYGNEDLARHSYLFQSVWRSITPFRGYLHGCCGSKTWRDTLIGFCHQLMEFGADCIFYDCFGAWSSFPCFNDRHDHGNRVDEQWEGRRKVYEEVRRLCGDTFVFGNEVLTDIAASYTQIVHSLTPNLYDSYYDFMKMFRYTFPEVVVTNRFLHNESKGFDKQLRWEFMMGLRYYMGEIWQFSMEREGGARAAQVVGEMNSLLSQYGEFMCQGLFTIVDTSPLPWNVHRAEYRARDGRLLRILYNATEEVQEACGFQLQPDEMRFDVFPE